MINNIRIDKLFLIILLIFISSINLFALDIKPIKDSTNFCYNKPIYTQTGYEYFKIGKKIYKNPLLKDSNKPNSERGVAIALTILTGPLGGHRIYLGTQPVVPIFYAVTLGGICTIPFIDLVHLVVVKDITRFENNEKIFMWIKDREKQ